MKPRRPNAFLLNEMILIIALLSVLMMLAGEPVRIFFGSVLRSQQVFSQQDCVDTLLSQLRAHTEQAAAVYVQPADERLGGDLLYLTGPDGTVCYQFSTGRAVCSMGDHVQQWEMPQVRFDWRLVTLPDQSQALSITTFQQHRRRGDLPAFRGSYVFVVHLANDHSRRILEYD